MSLYLQAAQGALRRAILQQYLQLKLDSCGCFAEEASILFDDERVFSTRHIEQVRHHQRLILLQPGSSTSQVARCLCCFLCCAVTHTVTNDLQGPLHMTQGDTIEDVIDASALTAEAHRPAPAAPSLPPAFYIFFGALACAVAIAGKGKACCMSGICLPARLQLLADTVLLSFAGASLLSLALQHRRHEAARHAAAAMHYLPL